MSGYGLGFTSAFPAADLGKGPVSELGGSQRDPRDGVNPAPRESLPRPFDLRNRDTGLPQEVSERVESRSHQSEASSTSEA